MLFPAPCKPSRLGDTGYELPADTRLFSLCLQARVHHCTSNVCVYVCAHMCVCLDSLFTVQYAINTLNIAHSHRSVNTCSTLMHYACLHLCLTFTVQRV